MENTKMLTSAAQVVAIVDHQVGLFHLVHDHEPNYFRQQMFVHAYIARAFDLPVVMTTSAQTGEWFAPRPRDDMLMIQQARTVLSRRRSSTCSRTPH